MDKQDVVYRFFTTIPPGKPHWNIVCVCVCACALSHTVIFNSCNPMDYSPPGSSFHGVIWARILEWNRFPPPGDLSKPGIEPATRMSPALAG